MINRIAKRHRYRSTFFMSKKSHSGGTIYKHIFSIQLPSIITLSEPPKKNQLFQILEKFWLIKLSNYMLLFLKIQLYY